MSDGRREFVLAGLRAAVLRTRLVENELLAIGLALKHGAIDEEGVMQWLHSEGLMHLMPDVFGGSTDTSAASVSPKPSPLNPASVASPTS